MTNNKSTKRALLFSVLAMLLSFSMMMGTTFAWFTDTATTGSNVITAGNLDIVLEYSIDDGETWEDAEGQVLEFKKGGNYHGYVGEVLWEPGCTYELPKIRVRNEGNLTAYVVLRVNGITGDEKLLEAIKFETKVTNVPESLKTGSAAATYTAMEGSSYEFFYRTPDGTVMMDWSLMAKGHTSLNTGHTDTSAEFTISGHMKEEAGNEYKNLKIEGVSITALATQAVYEYDSNGREYDENATLPNVWDGTVPTEMPETLVVDGETTTVHVKDAAAFVYLSTLSNKWSALYTDGNGTTHTNYANGAGANYYYSGKWTVSLEADIDLGNYPIDPVSIVIGQNTGYSTFNGNNHTIRNINTTTGLFADDNRASYSNLKLINVTATRGALVGSSRSSITNVTVKNATISGENYVGGLVGSAYSSVTNCTVEDSSVKGTGKEAGGLIGYIETTSTGTPAEVRNNTVSNVSVYAGNRAAGLVAQVNARVKVYNNTIDTVTVGAADTSEYAADAVISNQITALENVYDNTVINANVTL